MRLGKANTVRWSAMGLAIALTGIMSAANAGALGAPYQPGGISNGTRSSDLHAVTGAGGESVLLAGSYLNRYAPGGSALWPMAQTLSGVVWADVGTDRLGNYVVVEEMVGQGGIFATVFNRNGTVITPRFRVDQGTMTDFSQPYVSMNSDGIFTIAWTVKLSANSFTRRNRVFNRNGSARGPEFVAQSGDFVTQLRSSIDASGRFSNLSLHVTPDFWHVRLAATRFDSNGNVVAPLSYITSPPNTVNYPVVAGNQSGDQVIAWMNYARDTNTQSIAFQRYSPGGQLLGGNVLVDASATEPFLPAVGVAEDGSFVVAWAARTAASNPNASWGLYARQYAKDGTALGAAFRIDNASAANPYSLSHTVAMNHAGEFTVMWQQYDGSQTSVWARNYALDNQPVAQTLTSGVPINALSGAAGTLRYLKFTVPLGTSNFNVTMSGAGDADMLIKHGAQPTPARYDISPAINGSNEGALVNNPPAGTFYIGLYGYTSYSNVSVRVDY
ncbi:PPC domain-containing protein [Lysobacter sp. CA199]|uniref:PPC domain-containing protein n=1 Tax=Lysobacter sp. CA199 TaxID=3455608 RepID=UPI003F8D7E11